MIDPSSLKEAKQAFLTAAEHAAKEAAAAAVAKAGMEAAKADLWFWVDNERKNKRAVQAATPKEDPFTGQSLPVAPPTPVVPPVNPPSPPPSGETPAVVGILARVAEKGGFGRSGTGVKYGVLIEEPNGNETWLNTFKDALGNDAKRLEGTNVKAFYSVSTFTRKDGSKGQSLTLEGVYSEEIPF